MAWHNRLNVNNLFASLLLWYWKFVLWTRLIFGKWHRQHWLYRKRARAGLGFIIDPTQALYVISLTRCYTKDPPCISSYPFAGLFQQQISIRSSQDFFTLREKKVCKRLCHQSFWNSVCVVWDFGRTIPSLLFKFSRKKRFHPIRDKKRMGNGVCLAVETRWSPKWPIWGPRKYAICENIGPICMGYILHFEGKEQIFLSRLDKIGMFPQYFWSVAGCICPRKPLAPLIT